ncbi:hypothetical protein [Pedobacter sp. Hv1]|uniref:hypothetical protein n=1 Tax=Pedobacter sp. Hv1 TaxID=1740090 RepID=UPI0006D8B35B|nr:hypothetical protein [Pedobacter sp. Hv1]KQB99315.1 hypothetical protein AQF98_17225 [Pedobacter sp. Hv1]
MACNTTNNKPLSIQFAADSNKIVISNINDASLFHLQKYINTDSSYQNLVSVLQTPVDDDSTSMEMDWPGKLSIANHQLVFTPQSPFIKGKAYLVETMISAEFASGKDIIESKVGYKVKPQQQLLKR